MQVEKDSDSTFKSLKQRSTIVKRIKNYLNVTDPKKKSIIRVQLIFKKAGVSWPLDDSNIRPYVGLNEYGNVVPDEDIFDDEELSSEDDFEFN